ncbi:antirestriction protein ArdA [Arthrobacter sp. A5]|uniref:antirestriction protein ArdA n=1 Tax=Arthrobacter sp. A5 TaxID=576926 RepID=UPI003DA87CD9
MNHEQLPEPTPERDRGTTPAIYVASLADYNNGRLLGTWIDCTGRRHHQIWPRLRRMGGLLRPRRRRLALLRRGLPRRIPHAGGIRRADHR